MSSTRSASIVSSSSTATRTNSVSYTPFLFRPNVGLIHPANRANYDEPNQSRSSKSSDRSSMSTTSSFDSIELKHVTTTLDGRRVYLSKKERLVQGYKQWKKEHRQFWNAMGPYIAF
jgi:hypothetical protein